MTWPIIKAVLIFAALFVLIEFLVKTGRELWHSRKVPWKEEARKPK